MTKLADIKVFRNNTWRDKNETLSGSGSTILNTVNIRHHLPILLKKYNIKTMFDAPCGDGNWIKEVDLPCEYTGGDIVPEFADKCEQNGLNTTLFDIRSDSFPDVDLWLCRDCWYHLCFADIHKAIDNFKSSNIKYLLVTSHEGKGHLGDIATGGFRKLNLQEHGNFGLNDNIDSIPDTTINNMQENMLLFVNPNYLQTRQEQPGYTKA